MGGPEWAIVVLILLLVVLVIIAGRKPQPEDDPRCYECKFGDPGPGRYCSRCGSER